MNKIKTSSQLRVKTGILASQRVPDKLDFLTFSGNPCFSFGQVKCNLYVIYSCFCDFLGKTKQEMQEYKLGADNVQPLLGGNSTSALKRCISYPLSSNLSYYSRAKVLFLLHICKKQERNFHD